MKLLLINPTHPSTPHISAVRVWRFAEELAKQGHQVVLLCAAPEGEQATDLTEIARHDWRRPWVLACDSGRTGWLDKNRLPLLARKAVTGWRMLWHGGDLGGWVKNAVDTVRQLGTFRPAVIWATFGMMEAVFVARRIAREARCPWVLDIKDNWELYVPRRLQRLMVARTRGWAALTANSCFTQEKARIWQRGDATVIYSGVDEAFFASTQRDRDDRDEFRINLVGSLYFGDRLDAFLTGIKQWAAGLTPAERSRVRLCYLGGDLRLFAEATGRVDTGIAVEALGYRPVVELAQQCRDAAVNAYIANPNTFHHKLLELLACRRPVLAFPSETEESWELARRVAGDLRTPATADEVQAELAQLHEQWREGAAQFADHAAVDAYSWPRQAVILDQVLQQTAGRGNPRDDS
ncbi:MAG: glycosyltransferase [Candidatus Competibacter sp.]|nr:glycosyltransferase [Candidatus Competibacter sp.]